MHRPRRRFGQHFLHDEAVLERMIEGIALAPDDNVVEVGPGEGALTDHLLDTLKRLKAVEIDRDLAARLRKRSARLELIEADVLRVDWNELLAGADNWRLVGNLPYNISTPFLGRIQPCAGVIRDAHFLLQKEVVDRLAAVPRTKGWGRLTVMIQYRFEVEALFGVPPSAFRPPPKVDSAFVRLIPRQVLEPLLDASVFAQVVATAFQQRRKTLRNALKSFAIDWQAIAVDEQLRPDQVDVSGYVVLSNAVAASAGSVHGARTER
jgi:16S rRNA (adenine1518-N6/adenine1519-N6)-dimethyltransferase